MLPPFRVLNPTTVQLSNHPLLVVVDDIIRLKKREHYCITNLIYYATTRKTGEPTRESLFIPRSAIVQSDGKSAVFLLDGSRVKLKQIEVRREMGERMEVSEGLGPNDRIVVRGLEGLTSGQRVRVKQGS